MKELISRLKNGPGYFSKKMVILEDHKLQINHREQEGSVKYHREFFAEKLKNGDFQLFTKNVCSKQEAGIYISTEEANYLIQFLSGKL